MNTKLLKSFVRIDSKGNVIQGSNIKRKSKPRIGRWREITPTNTCCFPSTVLTYNIADVALTNAKFTLLCDAVAKVEVTTGSSSTTLTDLISALNAKLDYIGVFSASGDDLVLTAKTDFTETVCSGTLSFTVTEA